MIESTPSNNLNGFDLKLLTINNIIALTETVEVGCPRHPGATAIGSQLQDGDRTDGWQNLTTQP